MGEDEQAWAGYLHLLGVYREIPICIIYKNQQTL